MFVARNDEEALSLVVARSPELVLLDVMMPLRSGYEVCERLRRHPDRRRITKPFSTHELTP